MRSLRVLPVGNGACSVIRQSRDLRLAIDNDLTSIIDCGRGSRGGQKAASYLEAELSARDWGALQSVVVTHWDADHWNGLSYFADNTLRPAPATKRKLKLYSPAIPLGLSPRLPAAIWTVISATSKSGVEATDVVRAWQKHFDVERTPVARGDTVELAGRPFEVKWPPRRLSGTIVEHAARILVEIENISRSNPRFRGALDEAYSRSDDGLFGTIERSADAGGGECDELLSNIDDEMVDSEIVPDLYGDVVQSDDPYAARAPEVVSLDPDEARHEPILDRTKHRRLIHAARRLQNDLSLVFHDRERRSLIVYGDAPAKVIESLAPQLHPYYFVQLAPHHGTHAMPPNAPHTTVCIAQCGQLQKSYWSAHTRKTSFDLAVCDFGAEGIQLPLDCSPWVC